MKTSDPEYKLYVKLHYWLDNNTTIWWTIFPASWNQTMATGKMLKGAGLKAGVPDLMFVQDGKVFFAEVKAPGGQLSQNQKDTIAALEASGSPCAVVRSIDDLADFLTEQGVAIIPKAIAA